MTSAISREDREDLLASLSERASRQRLVLALHNYNILYPWQREFIDETSIYHESCLCAANQIGKTLVGTTVDAFHLLGDYPDDWVGHKFEFAPLCWGLGYSMEKTRDLLQTALFGQFVGNQFQGGLIPKERIVPRGWESAGGTVNAMRTVQIYHKSGDIAKQQFWSYSQGQHAIMGDVVDWFHVDEEPRDQAIRPQLVTRTINGDQGRGGRGIYTFTPENGLTSLVMMFKENPSASQSYMQKGWDDAPHMTEEKRTRMLAVYEEWQRDMRTKGEPMLGEGRIYALSDEFITCDEPDIPDHWFVIGGMDFGSDHPQAHILLLEDRDNGRFYVTRGYKERRVSANDAWGAVKPWAEGIPFAWPHDGLQGEKGRTDSLQLKVHYENAGFKMLHTQATWEAGGNSVETGLFEIGGLMRKGLFKVCRGLGDVLAEIRQYHRKDGKIVKVQDDLLDAIRYAYMMRRYAVRVGEVGIVPKKINFQGWN